MPADGRIITWTWCKNTEVLFVWTTRGSGEKEEEEHQKKQDKKNPTQAF
jgi:hypothetical protein